MLNNGIRSTMGFVGAALAIAAFYLIFMVVDWRIGLGCSVLFAWELKTLFNKHPGDTISEIFWRLSSSPSLPFFFGGLTVYIIENNLLQNPYAIAAVIYLEGHFFFQSQDVYKKLWNK